MKRTSLRRRTPLRSRRREAHPRLARPGVPTAFPKGWNALCVAIRIRDEFTCRRCGRSGLMANRATDHIIPRRIGGDNDPANLATLCQRCHAWKSHVLEPALYRGDVLAFRRFLRQIGEPGPSAEVVGAAFGRLGALVAQDTLERLVARGPGSPPGEAG